MVPKISKGVDLVIAGRDPGKRADEARALGTPILGEEYVGPLCEGVSPDELTAR